MNMSSLQPIAALPRDQTVLSLRQKLNGGSSDAGTRHQAPASSGDAYKALKERVHLKVLDMFDLSALEALAPEQKSP
jgi:pilus assembly protein CpaF